MKNADLHTHSHYSTDSDVSPTQLVKNAKKAGIKYLAITDHDSIGGVKEAIRAGKKYGVEVIPGVELHSKFGEILAYFIDVKSKIIIDLCKKNKQITNKRAKTTIKLFNKHGYKLDFDEIKRHYKRDIVERQLIAFELIRKGYSKSFRESFDKFLAKGQPYYIKANFTSTLKVVRLIRKSGALPVLAHPYDPSDVYKNEFKIIKQLVKVGLVGMEKYAGAFRSACYEDYLKKAKKLVKKYNLVFTSGSDYHGTIHKYNVLGKSNCDEKVVQRLKELAM